MLTQCLTKYTLKVRLGEPLLPEDDTPENRAERLSADEMLELTLCEPAMGSGAFLNEAVGQLAHKYLEKKQAELGETIPAEQYQAEWAKVKYHYVVHNAYGVDLNPLAAELGKISLWLNVLQPGVEAPFLDERLAVGNSLIGARREVFASHLLTHGGGKQHDNWLSAVPERVPLRPADAAPGTDVQFAPRPEQSVYHFLLPQSGMVSYADDKVVKELRPEEAAALKQWRSELCKPYSQNEVEQLVTLSDRIDALWQSWAKERAGRAQRLRQPVQLWGQKTNERDRAQTEAAAAPARFLSVEECEDVIAERERQATSGQRLQWVMDYWCALWFWPVLEADLSPTREDWLAEVAALLEGGQPAAAQLSDAASQRSEVVRRVAAEQHFFHWQLTFAEVFAQRGGMDVFLGNPPWVKVEWKEAGILGDIDPLLNLRKRSAKQVNDQRKAVLGRNEALAADYLSELSAMQGQGAYIANGANYPLLRGVQGNLYKCFIERTTALAGALGSSGIIHQKGLFDDPRGGALRTFLASRLQWHLHFINKLVLFTDIKDEKHYEFSIVAGRATVPGIAQVSNLFHPRTLDESLTHDGVGKVPGIKTDAGHWDLRGHRSRIVRIDDEALALFAKLYDPEGTPAREARLPVVHSEEILEVLKRFAEVPRTLGSCPDDWYSTVCFDETGRVKDGTIQRETRFPESASEWVVSGPHFYVGTPFNKTPNEGCKHNQDYSSIDLTVIADDYLPRTNYVPACSPEEYLERTPHWNGKPVTEFYRHVHRRMIAPTGERSLVPAVIPPGAAHPNPVVSVSYATNQLLLAMSGAAASLPYDFFLKSTGKSDCYGEQFASFPLPAEGKIRAHLIHRALRLNCLTTHYADLWQDVATADIAQDAFTKNDPRLPTWSHLTPTWTRESALRTPYERRQTLVELDALAALSLGLTMDQLLLIYRVQFPVLQQYERETYYDQRGKIVFTVNRGLSGVGLTRKQWEEVQDATAGGALPGWAHDQLGPYEPPFDSCDREADMAEAYRVFQERLGLDS